MSEKKYRKDEEKPRQKQSYLSRAAKAEIPEIIKVLDAGGVILYPTDTVWGLGCDATNEAAVRRIFEIKKRADSKSMIVLVDSDPKIDFYVKDVPAVSWDVVDYATRPTTIIYDNARNLAPSLIAEDGSVGIRITKEDFTKLLCFRYRKAIVSTSANISGEPAPDMFLEIDDEIKNSVDYIVKYRQDDHKISRPSSIIKIGQGGEVKVIRA